jgi:DNA-nicking Smr family endonuclease
MKKTTDHELWEEVRKSVRPLGRRKNSAAARAPRATPIVPPLVNNRSVAPRDKSPPHLIAFDRSQLQKLVKQHPDARIDLHGETLDSARQKLLRFLEIQHAQGNRLVLVITGKGSSESGRAGRLKREVPLWLEDAAFRHHVTSFHASHQRHGGEGALYIKLRRIR